MAFPRPEQVVVDVESVVRDYLRPATAHSPPGDLPPKYEEVQAASSQVGECWGSYDIPIWMNFTNCSPPKMHLNIQIAEEEAPPPQYDESMTLASNVVPRNNTSSSIPSTSATPAVPMPTSASQ